MALGAISATLLMMTEGADFQRSQGYAEKQGVGIFLLKPPEALEMVTCGNVSWTKGMVSEQGSSPQLATLPFCSSLPWLTALPDWSERRELEMKCSWRL